MILNSPLSCQLPKLESSTTLEYQLPLNLNQDQIGQKSIEWAAGLFEGEGWLCRTGNGFSWEIAIEMTDLDVLEDFYRSIGCRGKIRMNTKRPSRPKHWKQTHLWRAGPRDVVYSIVKDLYPYLCSRRRRTCDEFLTWYDQKTT